MFNWLFGVLKRKKRKIIRARTFVCKHCKLTCETCTTRFCWACYTNPGNPCPRCGKTNLMEKEQESDIKTSHEKSA